MSTTESIEVGDRWEVAGDSVVLLDGDGWHSETWKRGDAVAFDGRPDPLLIRLRNEHTGNTGTFSSVPSGWKRLPRATESIEEKRRGLKVGDLIEDPALLKVGMRVRLAKPFGAPDDFQIAGGHEGRWWNPDSMTFHETHAIRDGLTFLGWATPPQPAPAPIVQRDTKPEKPAASPPTKEVALPFKRHPECHEDHSQPVLCKTCELYIADAAQKKDIRLHWEDYNEASRWRKEQRPHEPSSSGLGGAVGGVWRLR